MRNWHPFIRETMDADARCGTRSPADLPGAAVLRAERRAVHEAHRGGRRDGRGTSSWAKSYHDEPLLIEAFAERLRPLLPGKVLFTAHSLPEKALANGDPYDRECRATAAAVAARLGLHRLGFRLPEPGHDRR